MPKKSLFGKSGSMLEQCMPETAREDLREPEITIKRVLNGYTVMVGYRESAIAKNLKEALGMIKDYFEETPDSEEE